MPDDNIAEPMDDNEALRRILGNMELVVDATKENYDGITVTTDIAVGTSAVVARVANAKAVKTVVHNKGATQVRITESGKTVALVPANTAKELPLRAKGEIKAITASSTSTVTVTTYTLE